MDVENIWSVDPDKEAQAIYGVMDDITLGCGLPV